MSRLLTLAATVMVLAPLHAADGKRLEIKVGDLKREALVFLPEAAPKSSAPVIFVFHGHGGTMKNAMDSFDCHQHWPEAICVYLQGLPTPTKSDPKGERPGWQNVEGAQGDRDLKFFDELLAHLKKTAKVDEKRLYATGFSNGGGFTYLLWAERGDVLTAVAPCGATAGRKLKDLKPKPCLHIAGQEDDVVQFEVQQRTMEAVRQVNGCEPNGQPWTKGGKVTGALYPSKAGAPFVSAIHAGGHEVPDQAGRLIVRFFKEQAKK